MVVHRSPVVARSFSVVLAVVATIVGSAALAASASAATYDPFFAAPTTIANFPITPPATQSRPWGVALGDFDGGGADLVTGRIEAGVARIAYQHGNGDGTFAAPTTFGANPYFPWRVAANNAWTFTTGDVNDDGKLDLVWAATAAGNAGCSLTGSTNATQTACETNGGVWRVVNIGDVRAILGNGNGTFQDNSYFVSGVQFAAGTLLARATLNGTSSIAVADVDGDNRSDLMVGGLEGTNVVIRELHNDGAGAFSVSTLISEAQGASPPTTGGAGAPIYQPPTSANILTVSPWGLAFGDADGDGDKDLWIGDRALYVYLYTNNGSGSFTLTPGDTVVSATRPNVYLAHENYRAALGFTPSLASGDVNGDNKADVVLGLQSGGQNPLTSTTAHDGEIVLDVSAAGAHTLFGTIADIGPDNVGGVARGTRILDVNGDGARDVVSGEYAGTVKFVRQLPPLDTDADGISDYVDNAPNDPNKPRLDMNTDGGVTYLDQLDNDFDTVLGNPEIPASWTRLGDVVDSDDDNDGVDDGADNCPLTANAGQADADGDGIGDACDPLDNRDSDSDNVPTGPLSGDPGYTAARDAAIQWSQGDTHFVIRIDALGRFFQNEFTGILSDAAISSPASWPTKCQGMYNTGDPDPGCGSLAGGKEVPVSLVAIPKQLWSDPEVVTWINDRNDNPLFELGDHATYHNDNTPLGDWANQTDRNFFSCELCGLTYRENYELLRVGQDTLLGNYDNSWVKQSGATAGSPKIDWGSSAHPLISFAPPFNTSDTTARRAAAELGYKAFSASVFEEGDAGTYGPIFTPEGSHHEQFDQFGMYHASADLELDPPDINNDTYDQGAFQTALQNATDDGGLTTWLIEEVEWSGRPCNDQPRLGTCNGGSNRENNTVYGPRWDAWLQLLDFVKNYPGGVAMTMGDVALAKAYDNAPTVANANQADANHNGVGDVIDGATLDLADANLVRNQTGQLSATLTNGAGDPIAGQKVTFHIDLDGDSNDDAPTATTDSNGVATKSVTATRAIGSGIGISADWDGKRATAGDNAQANVTDTTTVTLDNTNPSSALIGDAVTVKATLTDSDGTPLEGRTVDFSIGGDANSGDTDSNGVASAQITLTEPSGGRTLTASFAGETGRAGDSDTASFNVLKHGTNLQLDGTNPTGGQLTDAVTFGATLIDTDTGALSGKTVTFTLGTVSVNRTTDSSGHASATITPVAPAGSQTIGVSFAGDGTYDPASDSDPFAVAKEVTVLTMPNVVVAKKGGNAKATATLKDDDNHVVAGRVVNFYALVRNAYKLYGQATTNSSGVASTTYPASLIGTAASPTHIRATFSTDATYLSSGVDALLYR